MLGKGMAQSRTVPRQAKTRCRYVQSGPLKSPKRTKQLLAHPRNVSINQQATCYIGHLCITMCAVLHRRLIRLRPRHKRFRSCRLKDSTSPRYNLSYRTPWTPRGSSGQNYLLEGRGGADQDQIESDIAKTIDLGWRYQIRSNLKPVSARA